jgi:hypothetical protein
LLLVSWVVALWSFAPESTPVDAARRYTPRPESGVYFDTNRAINDVGGEAGYPTPETRMAVRNA